MRTQPPHVVDAFHTRQHLTPVVGADRGPPKMNAAVSLSSGSRASQPVPGGPALADQPGSERKVWFPVGLFGLIADIVGSIVEFILFTFQAIVSFLFGVPQG